MAKSQKATVPQKKRHLSPAQSPRTAANLPKSWPLIALQLFLGTGAIVGGVALILDPDGGLLSMPLSLIQHSPFSSYLIPGIILLLALGVGPLLIASSLITRWSWRLGEHLNLFKDRHWSWTFSLYTGFALIIWISTQVYFMQDVYAIHAIYMLLGLLIQMVTLLPGVQRVYALQQFKTVSIKAD
ncbi:hypothetical protein ACX93W_15210 [Paenibacillus sp. CAU 1782]